MTTVADVLYLLELSRDSVPVYVVLDGQPYPARAALQVCGGRVELDRLEPAPGGQAEEPLTSSGLCTLLRDYPAELAIALPGGVLASVSLGRGHPLPGGLIWRSPGMAMVFGPTIEVNRTLRSLCALERTWLEK